MQNYANIAEQLQNYLLRSAELDKRVAQSIEESRAAIAQARQDIKELTGYRNQVIEFKPQIKPVDQPMRLKISI